MLLPSPKQIGLLLDKVICGADFTATNTVADWLHEFVPVTVTEYIPPMDMVALLREGFCMVELKFDGPAHL